MLRWRKAIPLFSFTIGRTRVASNTETEDAEMEMAKSQHLREDIFHLMEQTNNDLAVQIDQTNFDFRKRIYEMKRAKEELEYQMKNTMVSQENAEKYLARFDIDKETFEESLEEALADLVDEFFER